MLQTEGMTEATYTPIFNTAMIDVNTMELSLETLRLATHSS
jgi:hypothetical protein